MPDLSNPPLWPGPDDAMQITDTPDEAQFRHLMDKMLDQMPATFDGRMVGNLAGGLISAYGCHDKASAMGMLRIAAQHVLAALEEPDTPMN